MDFLLWHELKAGQIPAEPARTLKSNSGNEYPKARRKTCLYGPGKIGLSIIFPVSSIHMAFFHAMAVYKWKTLIRLLFIKCICYFLSFSLYQQSVKFQIKDPFLQRGRDAIRKLFNVHEIYVDRFKRMICDIGTWVEM